MAASSSIASTGDSLKEGSSIGGISSIGACFGPSGIVASSAAIAFSSTGEISSSKAGYYSAAGRISSIWGASY